MPGLTLYSGNRLEILADRFADIVSSSPLAVMKKETIILQSMGMMKWLTVEMSRRLGIWSNYEYVFPNRMVGRILDAFIPGRGDERFFDKEIMTWRCMDLILRGKSDPALGELSQYIKNDAAGIKLYQVASKIIDLFDQYMTFRPDMILDWDSGGMPGEWQAELWRRLTGAMNGDHPPAMLQKVYSALNSGGSFHPTGLPDRITVFGISYLPVYHLNILRAASFYSEVNLFILNPSREYWGNILTDKERQKVISSSPLVPGDPEEYLHMEQGNTLLASFGRVGRDFLYNIFSSDLDTEDLFAEPEGASLLSMIQSDIYYLRNGAPGEGKRIFTVDEIMSDGSLTVSSCHSRMREVEVLHDHILDLMNRDSTLTPADILVMSPDIEEYSSPVRGIFGRGGEGVPHIPFRIVDRKLKNENTAVETFFKVLALGGERFTSASVLSIAECDEIMEKFGLGHAEMDMAGRWVREAPVFWGIDSAHKEELGLPAVHENTWSFGFERMLMGGIMEGRDELSLGVLPYPGVEGSDLITLGKFMSLFNALREIRCMLLEEYTPAGWGGIADRILGMLFVEESVPSALDPVSEAALRLRSMDGGAFPGRVKVNVIAEYFDRALSDFSSARDFVSGSLTFCEMLPMRSIPCRVICILGMNDWSFPRKSRSLSFDITSASPKRGDRSVRDEDRYLFLETLISARDHLYISYTGRSQNSNSELNPSPVVSELLEYIDENYAVEPGAGSMKDFIVKEHRIQPYNPVYFIPGSGYFTYHGSRIEGAKSYALGDKHDYRFMERTLPPLSEDEKHITTDELAAFLANPCRAMMNRRLGLYLGLRSDEFIEEEPFFADPFDRYSLDSGIMKALLAGTDRDMHFGLVKAGGSLPHGMPGVVAYESSYLQVKQFFDRFSHMLTDKGPDLDVTLDISGYRLSGIVNNVYAGKAVFFRYASAKGIDLLTAWVTHLALCASGFLKGDTLLVSRNGARSWSKTSGAGEILAELLGLYSEGMTRPLPLFPGSSLKYAEAFFSGKEGEPSALGMKEAYKAFDSSFIPGDSSDPYIGKFYSELAACSKEFQRMTLMIYKPVFENMVSGAEL